ncbi:GNAT family N-acetyltransferase [Herpetosiphon sp. NSE202]|uniref:GNAT family N-acetyltransferase n=1 Tax=Herpetosiphon sp. NSE202 TaxID=3351349 RepID=UPI00363BF83E
MFSSSRLTLRSVGQEDLPIFHQWWGDPEIMALQTDGDIRLRHEPTNVMMFDHWFRDGGSDVGFSIELTATGQLIGFTNVWGAQLKNRSAELGIMLDRAFWDNGYGTEAMHLVVRYVFAELNFHRLQLTVRDYNQRAQHVYSKVGFQVAGRLRQINFRNGRWHDDIVMDLLQDEYLATHGAYPASPTMP